MSPSDTPTTLPVQAWADVIENRIIRRKMEVRRKYFMGAGYPCIGKDASRKGLEKIALTSKKQ